LTGSPIKDVVFNDEDGDASTETIPRDITTFIKAHGATWEILKSPSMVNASVDAAGMLTVSIADTINYEDHTVTVEATDSRGAMESVDVTVRRNRKPTMGEALGTPTGVIWLGTQSSKKIKDVKYTIGSRGCNADCVFGDDDTLMFEVASGNVRLVTGAHKDADEITVTGLMTSYNGAESTNGDRTTAELVVSNFNSVFLAVRVVDTGSLPSGYRERLVEVKVNEALRPKPNSFLPTLALDFGQSTNPFSATDVDEIPDDITAAEIRAVFEDPDGLTTLGNTYPIEVKSKHPAIATVTPVGDPATSWRINAIGEGQATIEVTLTEPTGTDDDATTTDNEEDRSTGFGQKATQTFTVNVRDR